MFRLNKFLLIKKSSYFFEFSTPFRNFCKMDPFFIYVKQNLSFYPLYLSWFSETFFKQTRISNKVL